MFIRRNYLQNYNRSVKRRVLKPLKKKKTILSLKERINLSKSFIMGIPVIPIRNNYLKKFMNTFSLTTPSLIDLYGTIYEYQDKVDVIAIDVSSHALHQERFGDLMFDAAAWTNLSQDHLDYHENMEEYFRAKKKIFNHLKKEKPDQK